LNVFFFDALVRHLCQRVERASQITVTFQQVRGSLWSGTATLTGTRISRQNHPISDFDLQAQRIDISISPWSWLFGERSFRKILIQEARGDFDRVGTAEQTRRPGLVVGNLGIEDLQLAVSDQTRSRPVAMDLEITKLTCTHFRSNGAAFDLLFRSNWNGRLNDRPVSVTTREIEKGRETHWKGEGLPIEVVGPYLGGPFRWIEQGEVDIDVDDRWSLKKDAEIEMHWDFVFRDLSAKAPEIESPALRAAAAAVVGYLNQHADRVHLGFDLFISPDRFEGNATAEAAGLADVVAAAAVRELAKQTGGDSQQIEHAGRELGTFAVEEFKAFLKRRRDRKQK
jgi:hypothetical protein